MKKEKVDRCIYKYTKGNGTFTYYAEVRRKDNGKPLRQSFRTLTDAKNWVRKVEASILEGRHVPDNKARKHTLSELIDRYIGLHLSKFPGRLRDQSSHLKWWQEKYGTKSLIQITPALLAEAKEELLKGITPRKRNRSTATVNRYFSSLSRAFTLAFQEWQWVNENPFRRVSKLKESAGRTRFLSKEELHTLLEYCKQSSNPHLFGMVLMAASMGLRFSEVANLKGKNLDFLNRLVILEMTKNGDARFVPLPDQVVTYLQSIQPKNPDDFLFPSKNPQKRHPYSLIRKAFQKALQLAGLKDVRYHDLRHTCASHLAMNGASQSELMEVLGHRSPTVSRRYVHFSKAHIAKVLQKTNNNLIGSSGENI